MRAAGDGERGVAEDDERRFDRVRADVALFHFCEVWLRFVDEADQVNFLAAVGDYELAAIVADGDGRFVFERGLWFEARLEWCCEAGAVGGVQVKDLA